MVVATKWKTSRLLRTLGITGWSILLLMFASPGWAARLSVTADRTALPIDEHVILTLALYDSDTRLRAEGVSPNIDLTVLHPDFHVGTIRDGFRYNAFRSRGRATSELIIELFPQREGMLVIPSFQIDSARSDPIDIRVVASADATTPLLFARAGSEPAEVFEQQQVLIYLDMYYRVDIDSAKLGGTVETEPLPLDLMEHYRLPNSERTEKVNGIDYKVLRSAWALFPKSAQALTLHLPDIWVATRDGQQRRLPHEQISLTPKSLPPHATRLIVGALEASVSNPPGALDVGEPASWRVSVRGPVSATALPGKLDTTADGNVNMFQDRAEPSREETDHGISYAASYTLTALSGEAGTVALAPLRLPYFDPNAGTVNQLELNFAPTRLKARPQAAADNVTPADPRSETAALDSVAWPLLSAILALLWLVTLASSVAFWQRKKLRVGENKAIPPGARPQVPTRPLLDRLSKALATTDLDEGIDVFERAHGPAPQLRALARDVRAQYFGATRGENAGDLEQRLAEWERKIGSYRHSARTNTWDPRHLFRPPHG